MKHSISAIITFSIALIVFAYPAIVNAQSCQPLYNGGVTERQYCPTPAPTKTPEQKIQEVNGDTAPSNTTKGGLTVGNKATTTTTPDTGPAALGLLALAPAGLLGVYLRRKA